MPSRFLLLFAVLTLSGRLLAQQSSFAIVEEKGPRANCVNIVFLSDGYTTGEMATYATDVQNVVDYLFTREPWNRYRSYCNIYRIAIASNQSGTDNGEAGGLRDTYFQTGFVSPGIDQLLTINSTGSSRVYALLNTWVPEHDIRIVLVNDPKYGGSGGPIAVASTNSSSKEVAEHELGHSFVGLTDEYDYEYPGYPSIEYPNATAKTVRSQIVWNSWIKDTTPVPRTPEDQLEFETEVGHFEGANYHTTNWFRPHDHSLMRYLGYPVGQVNREAYVTTYYSKVTPVDSWTPTALVQTITTRGPLAFQVTPKVPSLAPALSVEWKIDDVVQAGETGNTLNVASQAIGNGVHKVAVVVADPTDWVRRDPNNRLKKEITWTLTLTNQIDPPLINTPLAGQIVKMGDQVEFNIAATNAGPLTYQWLFNGKVIPGVVGTKHTIVAAALTHGGAYAVKITGSGGTVTSTADLVVVDPTPRTYAAAVGKTLTIVLKMGGPAPAVAWTHNGNLLANDAHLTGATTGTIAVKPVTAADDGDYLWTVGGTLVGGAPFHLSVTTAKPDYPAGSIVLNDAMIGDTYAFQVPLPANLATSPSSYAATGLPPGLKIDSKTGIISGKPTAVSKDALGYPVTLTLGNDLGKTAVAARLRVFSLPSGVAGVFCGPVTRGSELEAGLGGRIDLTILATASYSGKIQLGPTSYSFNGVLESDVNGLAPPAGNFTIKPKNGPVAGIAIAFTVDATANSLSGGVASSAAPASFSAWRQVVPAAALQGYYTFGWGLEPGDVADAGKPHGISHGSFTVASTGKLTVSGKTADNETITCTGHVGPQGEVLVFQSLYTTATKGSVQGVMDIEPGIAGDGSDTTLRALPALTWRRPPNNPSATARTYKAGFGPFTVAVFGGRYLKPATTAIVMGLPSVPGNASLTFDLTVGEDPKGIDAGITVQIKPGGTVVLPPKDQNPKKTTLTVTPATGVFKGTYTTTDDNPRPPPATPRSIVRPVSFQGIITRMNGVSRGVGFFLRPALPADAPQTTTTTSPIGSGRVLLE